MTSSLARRLLISRRDLDITQDDLARRAGNVSPAYISSLERGKVTNPTADVLESLAAALGVAPEYLIGWSDDPTGESQPASLAEGRIVYQVGSPSTYRLVQEFLDIYTELSPEDQRMLLELAEKLRRAGDVRIIGE